MDNYKRYHCIDCDNYYKSKLTLNVHKRQYCLKRDTPAAAKKLLKNRLPSLPPGTVMETYSIPSSMSLSPSSSPRETSSPKIKSSATLTPVQVSNRTNRPNIVKQPPQPVSTAPEVPPLYPEQEFSEEDSAYWMEFITGEQC